MKRIKLPIEEIKSLYLTHHLAPAQIAILAGVTRQAIWKALKKEGVDTSKDKGCNIECTCDYCGKPIKKTRAYWRRHSQHFCCDEHYYASRCNPNYSQWRQGQRLARAIVSQYFRLEKENVVHHKNGDNRNNDKSNLAIFLNQSEHMRYHHGKSKVNPIWDGSSLNQEI